jgi:hypothetical protein
MKQADLDRAVARATGETVSRIKHLGFLLIDQAEQEVNETDSVVASVDRADADCPSESHWRPHYDLVTT